MKLTRFSSVILSAVIIGFSLSAIFGTQTLQASFGTSPPWVRNDHMLPGTSYESVIDLSRSDASKAMQVAVRLNGDEKLVDWISIPDMDKLIMEPGQTTLPMKVIVDVPKKAALRDYIAYIRISLVPVQSVQGQGGTVAITLGANIQVSISVTGDRVEDYKVESINTDLLYEDEPFVLTTKITNTGNTELTEIDGTIEIYDSQQKEVLESLKFEPFTSRPISPETTAIRKMAYPDLELQKGTYWIDIKVTDGKDVKYENRLYQMVEARVVPVVTAEDAQGAKPALPGTTAEEEAEQTSVPQVIQVNIPELKPAADETDNALLIFGLAGLSFGFLAMIGVIVVLVVVLKNQQKGPQVAGNAPYAAPSQPMPMQAQPPEPKPQASENKPLEANPPESAKMNTDAESQIQ